MDCEIRGAVLAFNIGSHLHAVGDLAGVPFPVEPETGRKSVAPQNRVETQATQYSGRIGRELDTRADWPEGLRLLVDHCGNVTLTKRRRGSQPADPGADDCDLWLCAHGVDARNLKIVWQTVKSVALKC